MTQEEYMTIPCGISHFNSGLMSRLETESKDEICIPADGKSTIHIIRQLSDIKAIVKCLWCGKEFETYYCKIKDGRGKYCSKRCIGKANGAMRIIDGKGVLKKGSQIGKKNTNWQGGNFQDCEICGKPFWKYPSRKQKTCSHECGCKRAELVRAGYLPSSNHRGAYKGIKSWWRLREEALSRDKFTCQFCGIDYSYNVSFLHAHHRVYLSNGGLNDLSNLITLCKDCHFKLHNIAGDLRKR
jgi:hypothetical protein